VRWKDETPDRTRANDVPIETPASSGV